MHRSPHLSVHSRSRRHSAVSGAAYRMRLRLFDDRARRWRDYGLPTDFDHRSYKRQGIARTPEPRLGQTATWTERRGQRTRLGNLLRAHRATQDGHAAVTPTLDVPGCRPVALGARSMALARAKVGAVYILIQLTNCVT